MKYIKGIKKKYLGINVTQIKLIDGSCVRGCIEACNDTRRPKCIYISIGFPEVYTYVSHFGGDFIHIIVRNCLGNISRG